MGKFEADVSHVFVLDLNSNMTDDLMEAMKTISISGNPRLETPDGGLLTDEYIRLGSESCVLCYFVDAVMCLFWLVI